MIYYALSLKNKSKNYNKIPYYVITFHVYQINEPGMISTMSFGFSSKDGPTHKKSVGLLPTSSSFLSNTPVILPRVKFWKRGLIKLTSYI